MTTNKISFGDSTVSLLTWTSDMDAWSFSLPAGPNGACPLSVTGEGTVCGSCYAMINRYGMPNVMNAQYSRLGWLKLHLPTRSGRKIIEDTLTLAIADNVANGYFRWFDSGDFFDPKMIEVVINVCQRTPKVRHWFPTRIWHTNNPVWRTPLAMLASLPNVSVRPSAIKFNENFPKIPELAAGTNVVTATQMSNTICPKTEFGGTCSTNNCRKCWHKRGNVSYLVHGIRGTQRPVNAMSDKIQAKRKDFMQSINLTVKGMSIVK